MSQNGDHKFECESIDVEIVILEKGIDLVLAALPQTIENTAKRVIIAAYRA